MPPTFVSLMYHNVVPPAGGPASDAALSPSITRYFVKAATFSEHLQLLAQRAHVMNAHDVQQFYFGAASPAASSKPRVHLTFDDGWRDCIEVGGPLLESHGFQATLFVTADYIGKPRFVSREELQAASGTTFHIGSHARTHCFLNELPDDQIRYELQSSKETLEEIVSADVDAISIPNGAVDARVRRIAADVGYRCVFVSATHMNTRRRGALDVGRVAIRNQTTAAEVLGFAEGRFLRERCRQQLLSLPKHVLGPGRYRSLRRRLLGEKHAQCDMHELT